MEQQGGLRNKSRIWTGILVNNLKFLESSKGFCGVYEKTDTRWDTWREMVKKALEQIIGINLKITEKEWLDKDCIKATETDV